MSLPPDPAPSLPAVAPEQWGRGEPWRTSTLRGRAYGPVSLELTALVERWLLSGHTHELVSLKRPDIYRYGALVVKLFPRVSLFDRVRPARAVRVAELHFRCLPIPSPRPLLAVGRGPGRPSLLLREHLEGELLSAAWREDERARRELAPFLWRMQAHDVLHGDLHPNNLIWTRGEWWLLDVEGVRHRLHSRQRVLEGQWARLLAHLDDERGLAQAFRAYLELARGARSPVAEDSWPRIRAEAELLARQFREVPIRGGLP